MKRLLPLAAAVASAALLVPSTPPASAATAAATTSTTAVQRSGALMPVQDSAACLALLATKPDLSTVAGLTALNASSPCAPAASASASPESPTTGQTFTCFGYGLGTIYEAFLNPLHFFRSSMFMVGCNGPGGLTVATCYAANSVPLGVPEVSALADAGFSGCDAIALPVTTIGGPAVIAGIGLAVDAGGNVATSGLLFQIVTA
jgi:hypothetical protein